MAAFLSFLFPGAGQLYNRQPLLAALFALPVALVLVGAAGAMLSARSAVIGRLFDVRFVVALLVLDVVLLAWRAGSMLQAHRYRARFSWRRAGTYVTAGLLLATVAMHAVPAWYAVKLIDMLSSVALEGSRRPRDDAAVAAIPALAGPSGELLPLAPPQIEPDPAAGERVNILLVGVDSGVGRDHALTDTMLVVSIDPDGRSAMVSVPRDIVNVPLPNGEPYPHKLNSLLQAVNAAPDKYPFGGGVPALKQTIGGLLGVPIHYFAAVDMAGFARIIDVIGGVEVEVARPINDPLYPGVQIPAGRVLMDGELALVYVRSRHSPGDDDFVRAGRQQQLLTAVRQKLTRTNLLTSLPGLLDAVKGTIATDVPSGRMPTLADAVQRAELSRLQQIVLQPPEYVTPATAADGAYVLLPDLARIRELGAELMGG